MTREALIEAAMQSCHVHAFIREDGEFQRTPVIVDTAYRTGFAFGVKAAIAAIESAGLAVVPVVCTNDMLDAATEGDWDPHTAWNTMIAAGKL